MAEVLLVLAVIAAAAILAVVASGGRVLARAAAALPDTWIERLGHGLGATAGLLGVRRRVALENLRAAFPDRDERWHRETLRSFYRHLGLLIVEFLRAPAMTPERLDGLVEVEGFEDFERERARGKGVIVAIAHFGNFELLGSFWSRRGLPVTAVTKRLPGNPANAFWLGQRRRAGLRELPDSGSLRDILAVLRRGEILAIMIDQNMLPRRAIFAPYFGRLAATTPAPAVLGQRTGAPVFLVLLHRLPGLRHRVTIEGPLTCPEGGEPEAERLAFTTALNRALEDHVRREPHLWWWVHRRWKTRPPTAAADPAAT